MAKGVLRWIGLTLAAAWALLLGYHALGSAEYLAYVATEAETIDLWAVLSVLDVALTAVGIAGGLWLLWRRRPWWGVLMLLLPLPTPYLVEANRCDVFPACYSSQWAILPRVAFDWNIRIRDVGERSAEIIAAKALQEANLRLFVGEGRLSAGRWRLETVDDNAGRGPKSVVVDARTGEAWILPAQ